MRNIIFVFAIALICTQCKKKDGCFDPENAIAGKTWELVALGDTIIPQSLNFTLKLDCDGDTFEALGGCNGHGGNFDLDTKETALTFELGPSTEIACDWLNLEQQYVNALRTANVYIYDNGKLTLLQEDIVVAEFK
jgi:heat shock protein HslJ